MKLRIDRSYSYLLNEHNSLFRKLGQIEPDFINAADVHVKALREGKKIIVCGNGGSAADAQHLAAELVGRFQMERAALPAIALTTDTSILTALVNDYESEILFSRQVEALAQKGDVLLGISTSGNSANIVNAVKSAKARGTKTVGLLGNEGGILSEHVDIPIIVPHSVTARIQEAHIFIIHCLADYIERSMFPIE